MTMSTSTITPQSTAPTLNSPTFREPILVQLPKIDTNPHPERQSPSPESRSVDLRSPILEEEEDETGSEAANEPLTPIDAHHPLAFQDKMDGAMDHDNAHTYGAVHTLPPLVLNTTAKPIPSARKEAKSSAEQSTPKTPSQKRPTSTSKDSGIKRAVSGFFRRSNSHSSSAIFPPLNQIDGDVLANNGSDPGLGRGQRKMEGRQTSGSGSPYTSRTNTPPTPGSVADNPNMQHHLNVEEPTKYDMFESRKKQISLTSTSFSLRDKLSKHKIRFAQPEKETKNVHRRHRATSVDLENPATASDPHAQLPPRQIWGLAADTGVGLKSRRMSLSLPDDFTVEVVELYSEFADQSKMVGRRGKSIGKGATAHVRLMNRKGGSASEMYAVKEFRGKSSNENSEDYEKKVKSEYSIAKSVRHPNIVKTFRLCTHNGRWNHVMEFCDQGDLFSLVSQKYLSKDDHLVDRLCLFKQLVQGLNYLHCNGIAHRDIKLENLLITKDSKLKITDFGVSEVFAGIHPGVRSAGGQCGKEMGEVRLCAPGMCGSPPYVAPEVVEKKTEYDPRLLDVWGAAVVMLCMCANGCLWQEAKQGNSMYDELVRGWAKWNTKHADSGDAGITESDYPHVSFFDQHINPPALRRVLLTMLNPDPSKRILMAAVAKNRWLKNAECCQIDSYDDPAVIIDASHSKSCSKNLTKVVHHNHLPPSAHLGHRLVRLPGSTEVF